MKLNLEEKEVDLILDLIDDHIDQAQFCKEDFENDPNLKAENEQYIKDLYNLRRSVTKDAN